VNGLRRTPGAGVERAEARPGAIEERERRELVAKHGEAVAHSARHPWLSQKALPKDDFNSARHLVQLLERSL
jgi:hypothetical protein